MASLQVALLLSILQAYSAFLMPANGFCRKQSLFTSLAMTATSPASSTGSNTPGGVVITGGARGVGFAYAVEFVKRGFPVLICDISASVKEAATAINLQYASSSTSDGTSTSTAHGQCHAIQCDITDPASVAVLAQTATDKLGFIKHWINNAGINGGRRPLIDVPDAEIERVVRVNLLGTLYCNKAAIKLMANQQQPPQPQPSPQAQPLSPTVSHIWNTVGSGVKGGGTPGYAVYGATKRGLPQLVETLVEETTNGVEGRADGTGQGRIHFHTLSPGMVFTRLLLEDSTSKLRKFPFGVLAAQPEEVAADLVPKIITTTENGAKVEYLTTDKILTRFFERFVLQRKSKYIDDDGNVIALPGEQYDVNGVRALY